MKLAVIDNRSPDSRADGAAVYVAQLGPALAQEHRVSIITLEPDIAHVPHAIRAIRRMLITDDPDVVHLNNLSGATLAAALWAIDERFPLAISLHDYRLLDRWRGLHRSLTTRADLVISPSHYALDCHLRHGLFARAITMVLPYGMDSHSPLGDDFPPPLAGSQEFPSPAREGGSGGGFLIFRSSYPEPFPIAIQEAFRMGKVVIASNVGGIPEMVRDGVNGFLVEPGDEVTIATAIDRLEKSPELVARMRASALETARLYDMRFHVARVTEAYRKLVTAERTGDLHRAA